MNKDKAVDKLFAGLAESLAPKRNLSLAEKADADTFFFAREIMGNEPVFPERLDEAIAGDWVKLYNFVFDFASPNGSKFGLVNSPRNSLKTTLLLARCAWLIAHDRNIRILYTTNTRDNAIQFSSMLQEALTHNEKLIDAYGSFSPESGTGRDESGAWRQDFFTVSGRTTNAREPTFTASSVGRTKVGMHYDVCLYDDCVDGENSQTSEGLMKTRKWFILSNSLVDQNSKYGPGGCILVNGTRYADGDLYGWLLGEVDADESPHARYHSVVLRAMENPECWDAVNKTFLNPQLNFPFILTEDKLAVQRELGPFHFYTQYQNECVSPEDAHFRSEWFTIIKAYDIPKELRYYVFTDIAFGLDDSNDRTALWVVGLDWERKAYCVDFDVGRWSLNERVKRIIGFAQKYEVTKVAMEQMDSNEGVKSELLRQRDQLRIRFKLEEIGGRSQESKMKRIVSMQPRFEQRRIFFAERDHNDWIGLKREYIYLNKFGVPQGEIVQEFVRFPRATHDDIPDALSDIDKIDHLTKTYYFPGASSRSMERTLGPTVTNGTVLYKMEVPGNGQAQVPQESSDPYARRAQRIRANRTRSYGSGLSSRSPNHGR